MAGARRCTGAVGNAGAGCWNGVVCCTMTGLFGMACCTIPGRFGCAACASVTDAMAAIAVSINVGAMLAAGRLADKRSPRTSPRSDVLPNTGTGLDFPVSGADYPTPPHAGTRLLG